VTDRHQSVDYAVLKHLCEIHSQAKLGIDLFDLVGLWILLFVHAGYEQKGHECLAPPKSLSGGA
jgi:hypothetical protein